MDKQFARILMLSVLLPAGASLAEAIDYDHIPIPVFQPDLVARLTKDASVDSIRQRSIEGRRFLEVVAAEQNAAVLRHGR